MLYYEYEFSYLVVSGFVGRVKAFSSLKTKPIFHLAWVFQFENDQRHESGKKTFYILLKYYLLPTPGKMWVFYIETKKSAYIAQSKNNLV